MGRLLAGRTPGPWRGPGAGRQPLRILVVEDEVKLAASLKRGLEAEGYAVDVLHDGLAARRRLAARGEAEPALRPPPARRHAARRRRLHPLPRAARPRLHAARPHAHRPRRDSRQGHRAWTAAPTTTSSSPSPSRSSWRASARCCAVRVRRCRRVSPSTGSSSIPPHTRSASTASAGRDEHQGVQPARALPAPPGQVLTRDRILDKVWDEEFDSFSNIVDVYVGRAAPQDRPAGPAEPHPDAARRGLRAGGRRGRGAAGAEASGAMADAPPRHVSSGRSTPTCSRAPSGGWRCSSPASSSSSSSCRGSSCT